MFGYSPGEPVFERISLTIYPGEKICILGANGSGKSTLLKLICGLVFPWAGQFTAFGDEISEKYFENDVLAKEYHRRVGFVFQNSDAQLFSTRVWDEIAFGPLQMGWGSEAVKQRVEDVLKMLNLCHLRDRSPYRLSGGEKKKVAVAAVLALNPEVLVLDEPTNGLDPKTQRWLTELLLELNNHGRTIITATHNLELAHAISDRVLVLSEQHELVYDGPSLAALENKELLMSVNLIDEYCHNHGDGAHIHLHTHD
ncbi:MAG: ABC transporter ATP-binding protein [Firmicutes bacterium]|nr:ABC transporter ATP-binding protein [Bacillota bacterium]